MSIIFNVLVVGKKRKIIVPNLKEFVVQSDYNRETKRYAYMYPNMTRQKGTWFDLVDDNLPAADSSKFCQYDYEADPNEIEYPFWIENEKTRLDLQPLILYEEYLNEFKEILSFLLDQSPKNTIYFLPRMQGYYDEVILGTFKLDKFIRLIQEGKILTNVVYILTKYDAYDLEYPLRHNFREYYLDEEQE